MQLIPMIVNHSTSKPVYPIFGLYFIFKNDSYRHSYRNRNTLLQIWESLDDSSDFYYLNQGIEFDYMTPFGRYCEMRPQGIAEYLNKI